MKSLSKIVMVIAVLLSSINSFAQIKNAKTDTVKIYGNCDMCKTSIEKAGNVKKVARLEWNKDTKKAILTYDGDKTSQDEIMKRIALAGYDNENFLAPDETYAKLPSCCQYERELKPIAKTQKAKIDMNAEHGGLNYSEIDSSTSIISQNLSQLKPVFDSYFSIKDGLIKTDAVTASAKATELIASIKAVDMNKLSAEEHTVWMRVAQDLTTNAESISKSKNVEKQREVFAKLSSNVFELIKETKQDAPVYYQHCPMYNDGKGANWLSKESAIANPYYGVQMLTCGNTIEIIK